MKDAKFSPLFETDLNFDIIDRHPNEDVDLERNSEDVILGAIGTPEDIDFLSLGLVPFTDYRFAVLESEADVWTESLVVEWLNPDSSVARRFDITNEFNFFRIDSDERYSEEFSDANQATQTVRVRSKAGELTGYRIELTPIGEDLVSDVAAEAPDLSFAGSFAQVQGVLENENDFDAYRLQLEGNTWYDVRGFSSPSGGAGLYRAVEDGYELVDRFSPSFNYWIAEPGASVASWFSPVDVRKNQTANAGSAMTKIAITAIKTKSGFLRSWFSAVFFGLNLSFTLLPICGRGRLASGPLLLRK